MYYHIIDAHSHLWLKQDTMVNGKQIKTCNNGRSMFMGEMRQMLPPFMIDGKNSAEVFLSNMDYAQVEAAVVTQEFIDGCQNDYLADVASRFGDRFFVCKLCDYHRGGYLEEAKQLVSKGFKAITIPGHRLKTTDDRIKLNCEEMMQMFHYMEDNGIILSLVLEEGTTQIPEIQEVIEECPNLKIAVGHF